MPPASWPPSTATNHNSSAFIGQLGWPNLQTRIALLSARQAGQKICPQPEQRMPVPSGSNVCPHSEQHHSPDWIVKGILPNKCRLPEDLPCLLRCATGKTRRSSLPGRRPRSETSDCCRCYAGKYLRPREAARGPRGALAAGFFSTYRFSPWERISAGMKGTLQPLPDASFPRGRRSQLLSEDWKRRFRCPTDAAAAADFWRNHARISQL
jgi:hypothetical protein